MGRPAPGCVRIGQLMGKVEAMGIAALEPVYLRRVLFFFFFTKKDLKFKGSVYDAE